MTSSGHSHSNRQRYDVACCVTCEWGETSPKIEKYVSCTARTAQRNDFELILMVTMETRHPVEESFGSEFPAICNHCGGMAA